MKRGSWTRASSSSVAAARRHRGRSRAARPSERPRARRRAARAARGGGRGARGRRTAGRPRGARACVVAVHVVTTHVAALRARMIAFSPRRARGGGCGRLRDRCESRSSRSTLSSLQWWGCCRSCSCARRSARRRATRTSSRWRRRTTSTARPAGCSSTAFAPSAGSPAAATEPATLDALTKASPAARGDAATKRCDDLVSKMKNAPLFEKNVPTLVALVDAGGKIVGRNGTNMSRGDDMAGTYPGLKATLADGAVRARTSGTRRTAYLASYVAVRDSSGTHHRARSSRRGRSTTRSRA